MGTWGFRGQPPASEQEDKARWAPAGQRNSLEMAARGWWVGSTSQISAHVALTPERAEWTAFGVQPSLNSAAIHKHSPGSPTSPQLS